MISQWPKIDKFPFVSCTINVTQLIDKFFLLVQYVIAGKQERYTFSELILIVFLQFWTTNSWVQMIQQITNARNLGRTIALITLRQRNYVEKNHCWSAIRRSNSLSFPSKDWIYCFCIFFKTWRTDLESGTLTAFQRSIQRSLNKA